MAAEDPDSGDTIVAADEPAAEASPGIGDGDPVDRLLGGLSVDDFLDALVDDLVADDEVGLATFLSQLRGPDGRAPLQLDPAAVRDLDERTTRYRLLDALGRGGMGEVRAARDGRLGRVVALKQLLPGRTNADTLRRFLQEAQITGQLEHPNIVPVYDIGVGPDANVYFTMKRVQGRPLKDILKDAPQPLVERLDTFKKVCDAVAFAHARGVVHRDLKPANIMVGGFGQVFVLDWGLAKLMSDDADETSGVRTDLSDLDLDGTSAERVMGTPAYMSPEQARGDLEAIDARSDIYALGGLLYHLLTGRRAFDSGPDLLIRVRDGRFPPPHAVARVPRELSSVVCKAMALDPAERYRSADALKADVQAWQQGQEVSAHRYTLQARIERWVVRNGAAVAWIVSAVVPLLVLGGVGLVVYVLSLALALDEANDARRDATLALADADLSAAVTLVEQGRFDEAADRFHQATAAFTELGVDSERATFTRAWLAPRITQPAWRMQGRVGRTVLSPDGREVLVHLPDDGYGGPSDIVHLSLPDGGRITHRSLPPTVVLGAGFRAEGPALARVEDGRVVVSGLDGTGSTPLEEPSAPPPIRGWVSIGPEQLVASHETGGTWVLTPEGSVVRGPLPYLLDDRPDRAGRFRTARPLDPDATERWSVVDLVEGQASWTGSFGMRLLGDDGSRVHYDDDGLRAVNADGQDRWSYPLQGLSDVTTGSDLLVAHVNGRRLHVLDHDGTLLGVQNVASGPSASRGRTQIVDGALLHRTHDELALTWLRHGSEGGGWRTREGAVALALSTDEWRVAVAHRDGRVALRERVSGAWLGSWDTRSSCADLVFDGNELLAACGDAGLWSFRPGLPPELLLDSAEGAPVAVECLAGHRYVATAEGELLRLDADGRVDLRAPVPGSRVWDLAASGDHLVASSRSHRHPGAFVFDAGLRPVELDLGRDAAYRLAVLPDGDVVVSSQRGQLRRIDLGTLEVTEVGNDRTETIMAVGASPDGTRLAAGRYDGSIAIVDLATGASVVTLPTHPRAIVDLVWSSHGPVLLTGDGVVEGLDPYRPWPAGHVFSADGSDAGVSAERLVRSAIAAGAWAAAAGVATKDPGVLDRLDPDDAVRVAHAAGRWSDVERHAGRGASLDEETLRVLQVAGER